MDARAFKGGLIIRFEQISDRNTAELWRDRYLLLPLSELEPPSGDEVYIHEAAVLEAAKARAREWAGRQNALRQRVRDRAAGAIQAVS